ncbi:MAG: hypothetical protein K2H72_09705, partial [Muribaculaceae bacterium]|nr:hypothetical protein [Muribaculaceae bacterium]
EQTVAYYPYGAVIADLGTNPTKQPYKFGGNGAASGSCVLAYLDQLGVYSELVLIAMAMPLRISSPRDVVSFLR